MSTHKISDPIVAALADSERDELFPLRHGASVVDELTGKRPHTSALQRWAHKGIAGVKLPTVRVGRAQYTTRRLLIEFFAAVGEARTSGVAPASNSVPRDRGRVTEEEEDALARHGIGQDGDE